MKKLILIVCCLAFCLSESKGQDILLGGFNPKANAYIVSSVDTIGQFVYYQQGANAGKLNSTDRIIVDFTGFVVERLITVSDQSGKSASIKLSTNNGLEIFMQGNLPIMFHNLPNNCVGLLSGTLYKDSNNFLKICP